MNKLHLKLLPPVQHQLAMKQFQEQTTMHLHLLKPNFNSSNDSSDMLDVLETY